MIAAPRAEAWRLSFAWRGFVANDRRRVLPVWTFH
jgi:hypothetical protein